MPEGLSFARREFAIALDYEAFDSLVERHAFRLRRGHELQPLDQRWRGAVFISRWRPKFKDGGGDAIFTLGLRDGRVATFVIF